MDTTHRPLAWPDDWPRTERRQVSRYSVSYLQAYAGLVTALNLMRATDVVVTADLPVTADGRGRKGCTALAAGHPGNCRRDGSRADGVSVNGDPGVAVYFTCGNVARVFASDMWLGAVDNLRAVALTLDALRAIDRAGAKQLLDRVFSGFAALGAPATADAPWSAVLGVSPDASPEAIRDAYKRRVRLEHPDAGGTHEAMLALRMAYARALEARGAMKRCCGSFEPHGSTRGPGENAG